jgi:hypothetical protein
MVPLPGGPSDKAGNSYERRWTVYALVDVLNGHAQSLRIEVPGEEGAGSEFRLMVGGVPEWHQAKRQRAAGPWTVRALVSEGVVQLWHPKLERGENCVFVSSTSADQMRELACRARSADTWEEFDANFLSAMAVRDDFDRLGRAWRDLDDQGVYEALRHLQVRTVDEDFLDRAVQDRLRPLTAGAEPATVAAVLARLADDSVHRELTAEDIWGYLADHGIAPRDLDRDGALVRHVANTVESYLANLRPLYIGGQELERPEARTAFDRLVDHDRVILAGAAGAGKSVIAGQVVAMARERRWAVLVLAADRLSDAATTSQLGIEFGLSDSPAVVLAGVAAGGDALLVIDQLDAVSTVSGRHPDRLRLVADLVREARSYPRLRVLLACRKFDLDNDRALRAVVKDGDAKVVAVGELAEDQVRSALTAAGLPAKVPDRLMRLLTVPLHLALYVELAQAGVGDVQSSRTLAQLYDRYWDAKRRACRMARDGDDDWLPVIKRLVDRMSDLQELAVPEAVLDDLDQQAGTMASQGVITIGQGRMSFFHETFFDYCFARLLLADGKTVRDLLTTSEQDLFRRAQVRQLLAYKRGSDFGGYLADLGWLVASSSVRLHIKVLVISLCETLVDPRPEEWRLLAALASDEQSPLRHRLWQALRRNPAWFPVLDVAGVWVEMLRVGGEDADRAMWALSGYVAEHGSRVCELLAEAPQEFLRSRRKRFLQMAAVHHSRDMVELLLAAVNDGDFSATDSDLSRVLRQLAADQPAWAAEVLAAVVRRASQMEEPENERLHLDGGLRASSRTLTSDIRKIATAAPAEYIDRILPQLLALMRANERPEWSATDLVRDALWSHRVYGHSGDLRTDVFDSMGTAIAALAAADPARCAAVLSRLREEPYEAAAFLLAQGYAGNPAAFADEAVDWLAATPGALLLGYTDAEAWVSRQLIAAISPHCSPAAFDRLVDTLLYYAPPFERTYKGLRYRGITELCLLNGIAPVHRPEPVERRLAELRRKFRTDDVDPPEGVRGGVVPPPIPEHRARRMTDRQWLRAMRRHTTSGPTWRGGRLIGDAGTQSQVLETLTKDDHQRFARLLLDIPPGTAEAYVCAILRGLAGARLDPALLSEVCRHTRDLSDSDTNRWLVRLIETHAAGTVDDELIQIVADVAIGDPDPGGHAPGRPPANDDLDGAALNSTRSAAALAIRQFLAEEPARLRIVEPALRRLVADAQPEVRAAAAAALTPLLYSNAELALALFHQAADQATLSSHYVEEFLRHAARRGRYANVAAHLHQMLADTRDEVRQAGARRLVLASYHIPDLDQEVDALLGSADDTIRETAVRVVAHNTTYPPRRQRSIEVISAAFHDPAKAVRDAAARCFYQLEDEPLTVYEPLIAALATSPALADDAGAVLHSLESSRQPLPPVALDLCEAFVRTHEGTIGDISTAAAGDAPYVVRLTLRMHAQATDTALRRRCLDLVDQLAVFGAHDIERELDNTER